MIVSGSRALPARIRPRSSSAFTVLRLADAGRTTSSSFTQNRIGAERIRLQPVSILYVPKQVLLRFSEFWLNIGSFLVAHDYESFVLRSRVS